jgi:SAM-dependent methyltransferase
MLKCKKNIKKELKMGKQYSSLARVYDSLNGDFDYSAYAKYLDKEIKDNESVRSSLVLDLACGTGKITFAMRDLGYDMTGVDLSEDMLSEAREICAERGITDILWLCQSMQEFELYGTVDACVCCLDSINYLDGPDALCATLSRLKFFVRPGGLFIFDINTEHKFRTIDGKCFMRDGEDDVCIWRAAFSAEEKRCLMMLDIFRREGELWSRSGEEHEEYAFSDEEIRTALENNGFAFEASYDELTEEKQNPDSMRVFYVARRK